MSDTSTLAALLEADQVAAASYDEDRWMAFVATFAERAAVERLFAALEASLSRFRPDSDLERLNRSTAESIIVVLDRMQDSHNFGAILRSAEAAGARLADGAVASQLDDLRLTFDGIPAPLLYVSSGQLLAVERHSLGFDHLDKFRREVSAVTPATVPLWRLPNVIAQLDAAERRAGIGQIFLNDLDDALDDARSTLDITDDGLAAAEKGFKKLMETNRILQNWMVVDAMLEGTLRHAEIQYLSDKGFPLKRAERFTSELIADYRSVDDFTAGFPTEKARDGHTVARLK